MTSKAGAMIRVGVTGASGRMGRTLIEFIGAAEDLALGAAVDRHDSPAVGRDAGEQAGRERAGVTVAPTVEEVIDDFDVMIDFSAPVATLGLLPALVKAGKKMVIGTTGFDADGESRIAAAAERIALVKAPNMSVGVNVAFRLIDLAAGALGDDVDVEVMEVHHRHKVDAPSGTAVRMGEILARALGRDLARDAVYGRQGITGARNAKTIGFSSLRGGDIVGDHTVLFAGSGERLEITHRSQSRANFAQGALRACRFLMNRDCGLYDMQDVLGFNEPLR